MSAHRATKHHLVPSAWRRPVLALAIWILAGCASGASPAEMERIAAALDLAPGMTVADVGAGDGEFAFELSALVGEEGRVIATEVKQSKVRQIGKRAKRQDLANVEAVLGTQGEIGLKPGCCDAVLLRLVYHHFEEPAPMRAGLRAALKPNGLLAIIDIVPQAGWRELPDVPDRGGHGIPPEQLLEEMAGDGFELVARFDDWNDDGERFCMVFMRRQAGSPVESLP